MFYLTYELDLSDVFGMLETTVFNKIKEGKKVKSPECDHMLFFLPKMLLVYSF